MAERRDFLRLRTYFGHAFGWRRALAWSLVANGTSFALGLFAYALTAP